MNISLAMIVLNNRGGMIQCLNSVKDYVDEIVVVDTGSTDGTQQAITEVAPDAKVLEWIDPNRHPEKGWISDFSYARNMSFDACTGDVILWLDADDIINHADKSRDPGLELRQRIEWHFSRETDVMEMRYHYKKDMHGKTLLMLPRYRVIRKDAMRWMWPVHEDLRPQRFLKKADLRKDECFIDHMKFESDEKPSAERNLWIMEKYLANGGEMDARLWSNFGGSYRALSRHDEAIEAYDKALALYGPDAEGAFISWMRSADCCYFKGDHEGAIIRYQRAQALFPHRHSTYHAIANVLIDGNKPKEAMEYLDVADGIPPADEGFVWQEEAATSTPMLVRAKAFMLTQQYEQALRLYAELAERYPKVEEFTKSRDMLKAVISDTRDYTAWEHVARMLPEAERRDFLRRAPERLRTHGAIAKAWKASRPPDRPTMAIYCGNANKPWCPKSLVKGIGGSEEAVIFLSREMAALGWHVEVYAFPPKDSIGLDEHGVGWYPFYTWGEDEPVDVFVAWRQMRPKQALDIGLGASSGQRWLWLHDVVIPEFFRSPWVEDVTGIFCLSDFHARPIPEPARSKVHMTKNGLNPEFFVDGRHHKHEFIYASSPDRGLEALLEDWPRIRAALPQSHLHVYYGFTENYIASMANNPELRRLKAAVESMIDQPGVVWHGMVGQKELAQAFADCGFWLYPTAWPETSCITGMKAQALGCIPITSRYKDSGVPETVVYDLGPEPRDSIIYNDADWRTEWVNSVIAAVQRPDLDDLRAEMMSWARETYSWSQVADQWNALFKVRSSALSNSPTPTGEPVTP